MPRPQPSPVTPLVRHTRSRRLATLVVVLAALLGLSAPSAAAADGLTMDATVLLEGHVRSGSWVAIDVHLRNDGPAITGELRLAGGAQGRTRFGTAVDLPTQSDKVYRLYVQPPAFGNELEIALVEGATTVATASAAYALHDPTQLVVGIVAEDPGTIVGGLRLLPNQNSLAPAVVTLDLADLPERVEAWGALDRLVWQDTDTSRLSPEQLAALQGWVAGGGRLVIVGGTAGPSSLGAFPDTFLPYRPTATTDVDAASLTGLLGKVPDDATGLPALSGELAAGRALATVGDRVVAAERTYGSGAVTIVGFDPTVSWIRDAGIGDGLWRQLLPARSGGGVILSDDSQIVAAASQLPALALPPIGGLIALLGAYILLIGPINYLVLRRLDRRELAWLTMPVLIAVFSAGAYGFGAVLRGSELIINEVAIVRGAPGTTEGTAQVYLGVFSPSRGTYQLRVPGGALLSSPSGGDFFGGDGTAASLDVLQGDPSRVRDLAVGFGSLRTVRAESPVEVPLVETDVRLVDDRLKGTIRNASTQTLHKPALVLGGTVATLEDLAPGATATVDVPREFEPFGQSLADRIVGPVFFGDPNSLGEDAARLYARATIINQLTWDPSWGSTTQLPADGPVLLAWGDDELLDVEIEGQTPRRTGNVLYFLPTDLAVSGDVTFRTDLLRSTVVSSDAGMLSKSPYNISFGQGTVELAYRPIAFRGQLDASQLVIGYNFGDFGGGVDPTPIEPLDTIPGKCDGSADADPACPIGFDGLPETELFDLTTSAWRRLPHLESSSRFAIAEPARYIDPLTGTVLVRFVNDRPDPVSFSLDFTIAGTMR